MRSLFRLLVIGGLVAFSVPALAADRLADMAFTHLDANGDGQLDAAELKQARAQRFERLDVNGDGVVTAAEQAEASNRMFRRAEAIEGAMAIRFEALDTDGNGKLTQDEFMNVPGGGMAVRLDKDGDGKVSRAEFQAGMAAVRAMR